MTALEIAANALATASIVLAARNNIHSWWTSIVGCALFGFVFFEARLYADVTLQFFFIGASIAGWWLWLHGAAGEPIPIRRAPPRLLVLMFATALVTGLGYGALLHHFTDAYAPFIDSAVLVLSVSAQLLLMWRMIETWVVWLLVNSIAIPLYAMRGLELTAILYVFYWFNTFYGGWIWYRSWRREPAAA